MKWRDLLYPERMVRLAARLFVALLALLIARELVFRFISQIRITDTDAALLLTALAALSPIAYLIRERRRKRTPRRPSRRGAERKPVLPPDPGGNG